MDAKRRPKWSQNEEREPKGHPLRNKNEKVRKRVRSSMQIDAKRVAKWTPKRCTNNPPTLWSGVLEHLEAKGGGFLPPTPLRSGRLAGASSKTQPVLAKRSKPRPVWLKRVVTVKKHAPRG